MTRNNAAPRPAYSLRFLTDLVRQYRWFPAATTILSCLFFLAALSRGETIWLLLAGAAVFLSSSAWGYSVRAFQQPFSPSLTHLKRHQYEQVWNSLAANGALAGQAAAGEHEEKELRRSVQTSVQNLIDLAQISQSDEVLEIGCGVGRVGREVAPHCKSWTGSDISQNMLAYARERLRGISNARFVLLRRGDLSEFDTGSFDVIFATNMLGHLDEIDRWRYIEEAFRVLRPGGRIFLDNIDIESDAGWSMFANDAARFHSLERPPYFPRFSTSAEFVAYAARAGFHAIGVHRRPPLFIVTAEKPRSSSTQ